MYDQYGFYSESLPPGGPGGAGGHGGEQDVNFDFDGFDFGGGSGAQGGSASFRDLFSQFFSGGRGGAALGAEHETGGDPPKQIQTYFSGAPRAPRQKNFAPRTEPRETRPRPR